MPLIVVHQESTHHSLIQSRRVSGSWVREIEAFLDDKIDGRSIMEILVHIVEPVLKKRVLNSKREIDIISGISLTRLLIHSPKAKPDADPDQLEHEG